MWCPMCGWGVFGMLVGTIIALAVFGLIVWLVVHAVRGRRGL